jgi:uncharacterized protein YukE
MSYETSDVKSVQKFLGEVKELADKINGVLPEDAEVKFDFDDFSEKFYKANDGIIKNRDTLKKEKIKLAEEYESYKSQIEKKWGSIDENLPDQYNKVVEELGSIKAAMKDDKVDLDVIKQQHQSEIERLQKQWEKQLADKTKELVEQNESLNKKAETFQNLHFNNLKREGLQKELERLNVNPEDRSLIMQANLGRAEISQTENGEYDVFFKDDNGQSLPKSDFWNAWASDERNAKYILAEENTGGGASGTTKAKGSSKLEQLQKKFNEATDLKTKIQISEEMARIK